MIKIETKEEKERMTWDKRYDRINDKSGERWWTVKSDGEETEWRETSGGVERVEADEEKVIRE